jgi:CYTH domain-containing protein
VAILSLSAIIWARSIFSGVRGHQAPADRVDTFVPARRSPTDERMHDWRKAVKNLWYQLRLLRLSAPSMLSTLVDSLDDVAEALGDDHDLAVLIEKLSADPDSFGGATSVERAVDLARSQQADLRRRAFRLGATVYAELPSGFAQRIECYWSNAVELGPELPTGGIADLEHPSTGPHSGAPSLMEHERKFLIDVIPELRSTGTELRQAYLAIDGTVAVRVRDAGADGCTLTVKGGRGAIRTELEWPISRQHFDAAWAISADRRVHKTRYRLPLDDYVAELDVFGDDLDGLVVVEVEFDSAESLSGFVPPRWFGREVTDDDRYTNASLAVHGRPVEPSTTP